MDRDAGTPDHGDEALHGDTGMIGSEPEEPMATRPGYKPERPAAGEQIEDTGPSDRSSVADEPPAPKRSAFATDDAGAADRAAVADAPVRFGADEETQRMDRPG